MRQVPAVVAFALGILLAPFVSAQYRTGIVYTQTLYTEYPQPVCGGTVYDPEIYVLPDKDLQVYAQGPHNNTVDTFYSFRREHSNGAWSGTPTEPHTAAKPAIGGPYARCGYSPEGTTGPIASQSVVHDTIGGRYFMAFSGGSADAITGRVYWASSTDGLHWTYYNFNAGSELITPVIYPVHHEICDVAPRIGGSGVGQLEMVLDGGYFVLWLRYGHDLNDEGGTLFDYERLAFRIAYDPTAPSGLGSKRQIWYDGAWRDHSGKFVWNYDRCNGGQCPAGPGDFVLAPHHSVQNMKFGPGDVKYDPNLFYWGYWVHFAQQDIAGDPIEWEYTDLRTPEWSHGGTVDITTVLEAYPGAQIYYPGVYFYSGWEDGVPGDYIFIPIDPGDSCTMGDYGGLRIVTAQLLR